ncbi:MAG: GGDEF domain-containing protein [Lachnospiraceae bacterium]|nr:GGDEF domain-containing protein [Lachnospiraceae bacterium]
MQKEKEPGLGIGGKLYIFIAITILVVSLGTALLSYWINARQIDNYFKRLSYSTANNFASLVDVDFYARLRKIAESEEYQELRDRADEAEDESLIEDYLKEQGIWEEYEQNRAFLCNYLENMDDVKYLYVIVLGDKDAVVDMYLMDDYENPLYETGYYEDREPELYGIEATSRIEPMISNGDWGWLCSAYATAFDDQGNPVCSIGCDVGMDEIMQERNTYLTMVLVASVILMALVIGGAMLFTRGVILKPLARLGDEMELFSPAEDTSYEEAHVVRNEPKSHDEIYDLYQGVRSMQIRIIDYLNELSAARKQQEFYQNSLEKAESDIRDKEKQLGEISATAFKDTMTGVGNKAAYLQKVEELTDSLLQSGGAFSIVMADVNNLKQVNDEYGHRSGDLYIKGCCHLICHVFKHSPVYRIGGDEFVVILLGEDYENREALLEEVRAEFAASFADESRPLYERYSAAIGMSDHIDGDATVEAIFKRADTEMYEAKVLFKKENGSYR